MIYALIYAENEEIYLYSTREKAEAALIQRMTYAVRQDDDLDFSDWGIISCSLDEEEDLVG